jgi:hypothetical protein
MVAMTPALYEEYTRRFVGNLIQAASTLNPLELFNGQTLSEPLLLTIMRKFLMPTNPAALSNKLWDPTRVAAIVATLSQTRFATSIETEVSYEDWLTLIAQEVFDASNTQMVEQCLVQAAHYFFTGKKLQLAQDGTLEVVDAPATYYNNLMDAGSGSGTVDRPINMAVATAGAWSTYANMETDINNIAAVPVSKGFKNKSNWLIFYPVVAEPAMTKSRDSGSTGKFSAIDLLVGKGFPRQNIIALDDTLCYTTAGAAPTNDLFDIVGADRSMVNIWKTMDLWVHAYAKSGANMSPIVVESGMTFCPQFTPLYCPSDKKLYKGVYRANAIVGT